MTSRKRTHKMEKLARLYDAEILPVWSRHFGRMLLRDLDLQPGAQILDVACGTGYPAVEIVRRLPDGARLIAIDGSSAMLDVARKKVEAMGAKSVFFRTESATPRLSFADDVYDLTLCNLGLAEHPEPARAIAEFARVTRPGGEVRVTVPLEGTFREFYDIYQEVLVKHDKHETLARLEEHIASTYHPPERCRAWLEDAGLTDVSVEVDEFTMLFKSSREFFFAPVIELGPLPIWKKLAGSGQEMQDVFWYIKEAIDAYFEGRAFEITARAGCVRGVVSQPPDLTEDAEPAAGSVDQAAPSDTPPILQIDDDVELDAFLEGAERPEHLDGADPQED